MSIETEQHYYMEKKTRITQGYFLFANINKIKFKYSNSKLKYNRVVLNFYLIVELKNRSFYIKRYSILVRINLKISSK